MTVEEMANWEARRCETLRIISYQGACVETLDDMGDDVIKQLFRYGQKIGFRAAVEMCEIRKVPRRLRRAAKLIKKLYRAALRISEGKPTQPIAAKHFR